MSDLSAVLNSATHEIDQAHTATQEARAADPGHGYEAKKDRTDTAEWLRALRHLHTARSDLADAEHLTALAARKHGATWQQVADVYGITKQAAQQRFTPVNEPLTARSYVAENKPVAPAPDPAPTLTRQQRRALEREQQRRGS